MKNESSASRLAAWLARTVKLGFLVEMILPSYRLVPVPIARRAPARLQPRRRF